MMMLKHLVLIDLVQQQDMSVKEEVQEMEKGMMLEKELKKLS
jgi:hypothetical protein